MTLYNIVVQCEGEISTAELKVKARPSSYKNKKPYITVIFLAKPFFSNNKHHKPICKRLVFKTE